MVELVRSRTLAAVLVLATLAACGRDPRGGATPPPEEEAPPEQPPLAVGTAERESPGDPRTLPAPSLADVEDDPGPRELWSYLVANSRAPVPEGSYCGGHFLDPAGGKRTLGALLSSYMSHASGGSRAYIEIGCGAPQRDEDFTIADSPPCPDDVPALCRRCALVIQLDEVAEDERIFLVAGKLLFQFRRNQPLEPATIFCVEAG